MSNLRWGEKTEAGWGRDVGAWGAASEEHAVSGAPMVHTVARIRYPDGRSHFIWSGPYDLTVGGTFLDLRFGFAEWNRSQRDDRNFTREWNRSLNPSGDKRFTGAAFDPNHVTSRIFVSSVSRELWHRWGATGGLQPRYSRVDLSGLTAPWLPSGHQIYPVGNAVMLAEGTLIIGCWAGPAREDDPSARNGFRYDVENGRWCFYHRRLREPAAGVDKGVGMPVNVGDELIHTVFPVGLHYGLRTCFAIKAGDVQVPQQDGTIRYPLTESGGPGYTANQVVYFFHSDHDGVGGVTDSGYFLSAPSASGLAPQSNLTNNANPLTNSLTRRILSAPSWETRNEYSSMFDFGGRAWWLRSNGGVDCTSSLSVVNQNVAVRSPAVIGGFSPDALSRLSSFSFDAGRAAVYRAAVPSSPSLAGAAIGIHMIPFQGDKSDAFVVGGNYLSKDPTIFQITALKEQLALNDTDRIQVSFVWPDEIDKGAALVDPGPARVTIDVIRSVDQGATWQLLANPFTGTLSGGQLRPNNDGFYVYTCELATLDSDVDRGETDYWVNTAQQEKYPGDRYFEGREAIDEGVRLLRWPPN